MATRKRISRYKVAKLKLYGSLILFTLIIIFIFILGRMTAPEKVVTVTQTIEVPSYQADKLPEIAEIHYYDVPLSESLQRYLYELCADEQVPVSLILAMIEHESGFNQEIISSTDDYGLMQLNAVNLEWLEEDYRCDDMLNPYQNLFCGVKIISSYITKYEDYGKALMAYNMGEYGAKKAWENGIDSTDYSTHILGLWQYYEEELNDQ